MNVIGSIAIAGSFQRIFPPHVYFNFLAFINSFFNLSISCQNFPFFCKNKEEIFQLSYGNKIFLRISVTMKAFLSRFSLTFLRNLWRALTGFFYFRSSYGQILFYFSAIWVHWWTLLVQLFDWYLLYQIYKFSHVYLYFISVWLYWL